MKPNLTSTSPDIQKRSYNFVNVSGETIPPFAVMQIVKNPRNWYSQEKDKTDFERAIGKVYGATGLPSDTFNNGTLLYCDKPSVYSEYRQDWTMMAFNSDAPIPKGGTGRCFYGEFPARALCGAVPRAEDSLVVSRNVWFARSYSGDYGCYRSAFGTAQVLEVDNGPNSEPKRINVRVLGVVPIQRRRVMLRVIANYEGVGIKKHPIKVAGYDTNTSGAETFAIDALVLRDRETLTFSHTGTYHVVGQGVYRLSGSVSGNATRVPYSVAFAPSTAADEGRLGLPAPYQFDLLRFYFDDLAQGWYLFQNLEGQKGRRVWGRSQVWFQGTVEVKKAPASIKIEHDLSGQVATDGPVQFVFTETGDADSQLWLGSNWWSAPWSYGWYGFGLGGYWGGYSPWVGGVGWNGGWFGPGYAVGNPLGAGFNNAIRIPFLHPDDV